MTLTGPAVTYTCETWTLSVGSQTVYWCLEDKL